jgi:hypothetical protein
MRSLSMQKAYGMLVPGLYSSVLRVSAPTLNVVIAGLDPAIHSVTAQLAEGSIHSLSSWAQAES